MEETAVWQILVNSDLIEGRGPMKPYDEKVYATEQAAWDVINDRAGVFGRHPRHWPDQNAMTWQEAKANNIPAGHDYDVQPLSLVVDPVPSVEPEGMPTGPEVDALSRLYALVYVCEDGAFYEDYDKSMDLLGQAKDALTSLSEYFYGKPPEPSTTL